MTPGFLIVVLSVWLSMSRSSWFLLLSLTAPFVALWAYDILFSDGEYEGFTELARADRRFFRVALRTGTFTVKGDEL